MSFDAWGRRRNATDWTFDNMASGYLFDRGYTGHEHLDEFSLINMNGRVYDPILGRFLSPDNYIQAPDYTQSMNRYSYAYNNPLIFTDPDGENPFWIALGIYTAYTYLRTAHENRNQETGKWAWNPIDWFGKESTVIVGVNTNTEFSNVTGYIAGGSGYYIPSLSYNNNYGPGFGYWSPQGANFTYPGANHNRPEEVVNGEISEVRQSHGAAWMEATYLEQGIYFINYASSVYNNLLFNNVTLEMGFAFYDFQRNYADMREANWMKSDKYFHAKANFQASHRGPVGYFFAEHFSNLREIWDQRIKGYPRSDSFLDQKANRYGREQSKHYGPNDYRKAIALNIQTT